jgi:hypothetical protein
MIGGICPTTLLCTYRLAAPGALQDPARESHRAGSPVRCLNDRVPGSPPAPRRVGHCQPLAVRAADLLFAVHRRPLSSAAIVTLASTATASTRAGPTSSAAALIAQLSSRRLGSSALIAEISATTACTCLPHTNAVSPPRRLT